MKNPAMVTIGADKALPAKLPGWKLVMFALGQLGWSLASWSVSNALTFFFLPPEKAGSAPLFPTFIYQGAIFGALTIIGLINAGGRIWDGITDPWVANLSDRSHSKIGRRRLFLLISALPTAALALLVFVPIASGATAAGRTTNAIWLAVTMTLYYWFITMYCTPYNALISELGHSPDERLGISTAISITWALGFAIGNQAYAIYPALEKAFGLDPTRAFQTTVGAFELVSAVLMMLPVIFIDERKYAEVHATDEGVFQAVASTFKNRDFRTFVFSDLPYWVALNFIQMGITYYMITLLGLDESLPSFLMLVMFVLSFVFYVPVNLIAKKVGKKPLLVVAFAAFALDFLLVFFLGKLPIPALAQAWLIVVIAALPMAIFGILPNAIVADIAESHGIETGQYKAGIFFGARTFMMKMGIALANLLFPSLLLLGKSAAHPVGIRLTAVCAFGFCLLGMLLFMRYDEKRVLKVLATKEGGVAAEPGLGKK
jgi:Na+/melibiose symporter-like transporter